MDEWTGGEDAIVMIFPSSFSATIKNKQEYFWGEKELKNHQIDPYLILKSTKMFPLSSNIFFIFLSIALVTQALCGEAWRKMLLYWIFFCFFWEFFSHKFHLNSIESEGKFDFTFCCGLLVIALMEFWR